MTATPARSLVFPARVVVGVGAADGLGALLLEEDDPGPLLVVCDAPFGPGNVANLRLALEAARAGVPTYVVEQVPMPERDFTGGEATRLWSELRAVSTVVERYEEVPVPVR